jgi:hypothetical protein
LGFFEGVNTGNGTITDFEKGNDCFDTTSEFFLIGFTKVYAYRGTDETLLYAGENELLATLSNFTGTLDSMDFIGEINVEYTDVPL